MKLFGWVLCKIWRVGLCRVGVESIFLNFLKFPKGKVNILLMKKLKMVDEVSKAGGCRMTPK